MRVVTAGLAIVLPAGLAVPATADRDVVRHPLIGSAGGGNTYPGAVRPFGMISWSPTSTRGDQTNTDSANPDLSLSSGVALDRGLMSA